MSTPIPTPRTDANAGCLIDSEEVVPADFARKLERELARVVELRAEFEKLAMTAAHTADRNTELRAEVERLKADGAASAFIDMSCRASRAEAELAAEQARLDWLEQRGPWEAWSDPCREPDFTLRGPIRAAIDSAMKEGAK